MYELRVILLIFIVLIAEFKSGDGVGKFYEELDYEKII